MKKIYFIFALFCMAEIPFISAQISHGGTPYSFNKTNISQEISFKTLPEVNVQQLIKEDERNYGKNMPYLLIEVKKVTVGTGKEEWGAVPGEEYYVLELGEIIATGNLIYKPLDKIISIEDIVFMNGSIIKEGTKGEIIDIKKYKPFVRYGVQFENHNDIYVVTQDQFTMVY